MSDIISNGLSVHSLECRSDPIYKIKLMFIADKHLVCCHVRVKIFVQVSLADSCTSASSLSLATASTPPTPAARRDPLPLGLEASAWLDR